MIPRLVFPDTPQVSDLTGAQEWFALLQPALRASKWKRAELVKAIAQQKGCSPRSIYRKLEALESSQNGLSALAKKPRADKGHFRIAQEAFEVIQAAFLSNTPNTSVRYIHRTLVRAVPQVMTYKTASGKDKVITVEMCRRVKNAMLQDPVMRLAFYDTTERKEFMRTYNGKVTAHHANHMWQMDMTRCDVEVVDPETLRFLRLRVHAIIDVYSGVIPGIAFSEDEDQTQTDLAFLRAILPKQGPYADKYPIFGVPEIMYWDNGKTYRSDHIERILKGLNVQSIHSKPRVSHTRGAIERFWGTEHGFERTLPAYVGENAKDRDSEELRNLRKATLKWLETGKDPGFGKRHLTIDEFKNIMLAWIITEYHQWVVDGKTRLQHFLETVPAKTQLLFDPTELFLLFARRKERTVTPDGGVKLDNKIWKIPSGVLAPYSGLKVLVLEDQFAMGDVRVIARQERNGQLTILGEAVPAPDIANSIASGEQRRAEKAQNTAAVNSLKEVQERLAHPDLIVARQIVKELDIAPTPAQLPATPAQLAAVNPPKTDLGEFGNFLKPSDTTDIDAFMSEINLSERKKP
ncbi:DDE-type integrase/transposase/recombinase [Deinococcus cellulosilyticus]|uniref:Integrase catalytic domain-containing protein n=1 Tax=Deinococcus cellulosilyticus (strain DSM 18568 / NBRC 106333 / KACC 11606 / 5516J-15) TaxID=1223518 RepID=A0A511N7I5_DEIC1|nr:DDE-type integrase/transposase/recombinase [Deinococcus cellulosilyticus]GEM48800.1 hypothetical protein DC3_44350 [Deinococcus cellulosilyticus NBRC 106333 = KACC 11606]